MRTTTVLLALLAGCASDPVFESGKAKLDAHDWPGAYKDFVKCAGTSTACVNNAGYAAFNAGDRATAQRWWTLAASRGDEYAIARLTEHRMPLPVQAPSQAGSSSTVVCTRAGITTICN